MHTTNQCLHADIATTSVNFAHNFSLIGQILHVQRVDRIHIIIATRKSLNHRNSNKKVMAVQRDHCSVADPEEGPCGPLTHPLLKLTL